MASNVESTRDSTQSTIEELKRQTKVTDQQLNTEIEQTDLPHLASYFDNIDDGYLQKMNLTSGQQTDVREKAKKGTLAAMILALTLWLESQVRGTFRALIVILLSLGKRLIAVQVFKYLLKEDFTLPLGPSQAKKPKLSFYRDYLQSRYKAQTLKSIPQWPPVQAKKIINLAMIEKEKIQNGQIDDEFVRQTITGKVEDILHQKTPVELKNILSSTKIGQKIVLIEGAPGSGKSTLALHICQEWAEERLFQEFDIAILVRLRDPIIKDAKTIADILPCVGRTTATEQETVIESMLGKGVLWVLDGWDELPSDLPQDSIMNKIIKPEMSRDSPLHESTVIVTSRPSSSAELHPLVSSRVEVLGFTPHQLEQYFTECLEGDLQAVQTLLDRIRENPVVEGSCYLPLNAAIVVNCFLSDNHSLPTTNHGIFISIVENSLKRYLQDRLGKTIPLGSITSPDSLPSELHTPFVQLCQLAYYGISQNKVTFTREDLTTLSISKSLSDIGIVQKIPSMLGVGSIVYYCFLHLSIQELLAAIHITLMPSRKQISVFEKLFGQPRFSAVFQFYAGITKLRTESWFLSKLPKFLYPHPTAIFDLVRKIIRSEPDYGIHSKYQIGNSKPLLLSLMHCLYEAEDSSLYAFVADLLNHKLNFASTTMNPIDCFSVGYFVSLATKSFALNLSDCSIGDQGCKFLARGLLKCPQGIYHIANIYLGGNPIDSGLIYLCEAFSTTTSLKTLDLHNCSLTISDDNGAALYQLLSENKSLEKLDLSNNTITSCRRIAAGLAVNTTLKILDLHNCKLTDHSIEELSTGLINNIKELNLRDNNSITKDGMNTLARHLTTHCPKLRVLRIRHMFESQFTETNEKRNKNKLSNITICTFVMRRVRV